MEVPVPGRETHPWALNLPTSPSRDSPDPLGILTVSGIYGPGNWAGWFLTTVASWLAIFRPAIERDTEGIHHDMIMHILFTNWAAIDLFRQLGFRQAAKNDEARKQLGGAIAAAVTMTFWGLHTALWQLGFCVFFDKGRDDRGSSSSIRAVRDVASQYRRSIVLLLGTVLPSIALVNFETYLPSVTDTGNSIADSIPALYLLDSESMTHRWALMGAGSVGMWSMTFSSFCLILVAHYYFDQPHRAPSFLRRGLDGEIDIPATLFVPTCWCFCLSALISFFLFGSHRILVLPVSFYMHIYLYVWFALWYVFIDLRERHQSVWNALPVDLQREHAGRVILGLLLFPSALFVFLSYCLLLAWLGMEVLLWVFCTVFEPRDSWRRNCFAMPCAPQKISDWDQAFGLMVGLVMLAVEVGPRIVRWALRGRDKEKGYTLVNGGEDSGGIST